MQTYLYLVGAIVSEVIATTALKASDGMSKGGPMLVVCVGYMISFYLLSLCLKTMDVGVAYAIWGAVGMVLIAILGAAIFGERLDAWGAVGIGLIIAGVVVLNTLSKSSIH